MAEAIWRISIRIMIAALVAGTAYLSPYKIAAAGTRLEVVKTRSVAAKVWPTGIAWSSDGARFAAIHDFGRIISVWNSSGHLITSIDREVTTGPYVGRSLAFMPDNRTILAPAPTPAHSPVASLGLWDTDTGALQRVVPPPSSERVWQAVVASIFVLSPDGSLVAFNPIDFREPTYIYRTSDWSLIKTKQIWRSDTVGLKPIVRSDVPGITPPYTFTPNNRTESVAALAFAPTNELAIGLLVGLATIDADPSSTFLNFMEGQGQPINRIAYSPNGQFIAAGARRSSAAARRPRGSFLQIFDAVSGNVVFQDDGIGEVVDVAWNRDGTILAAISEGRSLYLYRPFADAKFRQEVAVSTGTLALAFSPSKAELAVSSDSGIDFYSVR